RCSRASVDFTVHDVASYIDEKYYELTDTRWGAKYDRNSQRAYFEGHERVDVVEHGSNYTDYFLGRKGHYYTLTDGDNPTWINPTLSSPCVLFFHDESPFLSVTEQEYEHAAAEFPELEDTTELIM
ncbi:unnamed protein product, partial [Didymodactylos carnosus]